MADHMKESDHMKEAMLVTEFCRKVQDYCARMRPTQYKVWDELRPEDQLLAVQAVAISLPSLVAKMCEVPSDGGSQGNG